MRRELACLVLSSMLLGACATSANLSLVGYRGAYTTHFEGIPDEAAVCALLHNASLEAVEWVQLGLRARSLGEKPGRLRSRWLFQGRIAPGQTVAVTLIDPPPGGRIELRVRASGAGYARRPGRPVERVAACSDASLAEALSTRGADRTVADLQVVRIERDETADDVLIAEP